MLIATMKEEPKEAEIISHKLLFRAGMINKVSAGIYNYMPLGLKVIRKIENIIRDEMNNAGCIELLPSSLIPAELWKDSGRWDLIGSSMFKLQDRTNRDFCLGPSHEETFTAIAKTYINSYKQLPVTLYQIATNV